MADLLIADDEIAIRQGLKKIISDFDLNLNCVGLAADGVQALEMVKMYRPQILLVDINMPRMDGLEMIDKARSLIPESKIIVVSGYDKFDYVRQALRLGVFDYILKPINHGSLYVVLSEAMKELEGRLKPREELAEEDVVSAVLQEIGRRYSDKELRLSTLADEFYVSTAALSRGIKERTGQNFSVYLTELRMQKAVDMINSSRGIMIYTLAEKVGCSSQHYFCKLFKEYMGCTPSEYIRVREKSKE
ncbi:MAG: response regulator [Lachnospiraceae bacterium]